MGRAIAHRVNGLWQPLLSNAAIGAPPNPPANLPPTGHFTYTVTGNTISVDGSSSSDPDGVIVNYAWDFGDGTVGSGATVAHTYTVAGAYVVTLTVKDDAGATATTKQTITIASLAWDWSDSNVPWSYSDTSVFTANWPTTITTNIVDLNAASGDFVTDLKNTVNAAGRKVVVRLPAGVFHIKSFVVPVASAPDQAFGFYIPNLYGLLGAGPDQTFVQMDGNSYTTAQLNGAGDKSGVGAGNNKGIVNMGTSAGPIQFAFCRIGDGASPVYCGGLTFRGDDQQTVTLDATLAVQSQPAPYGGVVFYQPTGGHISYVRFQASDHAAFSRPPFEAGNAGTQYGTLTYEHCEMDGRLSGDLDSTRPRRGGVVMMNNETYSLLTDCWLHHSNVSRYAANDQNRVTTGSYNATRVKMEQISNTQNSGLGGGTNASCMGWECCGGTITLTDCILSQDNPSTTSQIPNHLQFTTVAARNPQGGRLIVIRGVFRNTGYPSQDGYLTIRAVTGTYWVSDGYDTTMNITNSQGVRKKALVYTGRYATTAFLAQNNASPETHYLVENS